MGHAVAYGGACYSIKEFKTYDSVNTDCSGEPSYETSWTVGVSVEEGCVRGYDDSSTSRYCDNTGFHYVRFFSSDNCTGNASHSIIGRNGCNLYRRRTVFESCSLAGPCEDNTAKSVV